ncbi:exostosin-like 2 [Brachionichthys hirsutus]|uniref:exostosin-like 2 n=1 Tax=Brachionichthys hirsutus TaxID=412623 RepID=UPI00360491F5
MRIPCCCLVIRLSHLLWLMLLLVLLSVTLTALLPAVEEVESHVVLKHPEVLREVAPQKESIAYGHHGDASEEGQKFTIIIQTYNRTDILLRILNHYQAVPHLQKIIIVWNNIGVATPEKIWKSFGPHPVPVIFKEQTSNLMRNRLQPFPELETDALLMLDDDTMISGPDSSFAFSVWKQFPDQIVGFVPRKHVVASGGVYTYGSYELRDPETSGGDKYSMVLIGAAFFHRRYLEIFSDQPPAVHELVDETQNCDDIATNFLVALYLRKQSKSTDGFNKPSGVFVKPTDLRNLENAGVSGFKGMWHRPEHFLQRSYCLNKLTEIYGFMPLSFSNLVISQFGFPNY